MPINRQGAFCAAARNLCEEFAPRNGAARVCGEGGANRALEKPAGTGRRRGICVKNLLPGTELQGLAGSKPRLEKARRPRVEARNLCEEFAPRNGATRASGEGGANRALKKPGVPGRRRGICVKNLLPGTKLQGFARRGEQTAPLKRPPEAGIGAEFV